MTITIILSAVVLVSIIAGVYYVDSLEERVEELEKKVSFQEVLISSLIEEGQDMGDNIRNLFDRVLELEEEFDIEDIDFNKTKSIKNDKC